MSNTIKNNLKLVQDRIRLKNRKQRNTGYKVTICGLVPMDFEHSFLYPKAVCFNPQTKVTSRDGWSSGNLRMVMSFQLKDMNPRINPLTVILLC